MKNKIILFLLFGTIIVSTLLPVSVALATENVKAKVQRILEETTIIRENGAKITQQNIELISLGGDSQGQILIFKGISNIDVVSSRTYSPGDLVFVNIDQNQEGGSEVYIVDYVRERGLWWLLIVFIVVVVLVGGKIGWRSLVALGISFWLIMKFLTPLILSGYNPLIVGPATALLILMCLVYITEGWNRKAHIAILSIFSALVVTFGLSWIFVHLTQLSGTSSEEVMFLIGDNIKAINFQGLLLAAIIIGALGVLDDIAIGQIEAVEQLIINNPAQTRAKIFSSAMAIGRAHLGAIINTLFLAYAGASLPLILLFNIKSEPFLSFSQVINNEEIATEIVRSLVGVIGLCLTMPIATILAVWLLFNKKR